MIKIMNIIVERMIKNSHIKIMLKISIIIFFGIIMIMIIMILMTMITIIIIIMIKK